MKKYIFNLAAIALLGAFLASCGNPSTTETNTQNTKENHTKNDDVSFEIKKYENRQSNCKNDDCTYVVLQIPKLNGGNQKVIDRINNMIDAQFHEAIKSRLPEPMGNASLQDMTEQFIEGYEMFILEFPDSERAWYLEIDGSKSELGKDYFTLYVNHNEYLGGAHPSRFVTLASFDLSSGNQIDILDRYDETQLLKLAEDRFRKIHSLSETKDLNDAGFMFENGRFVLPENMALTSEGVLFVYNSYEVAAYSEGETRFVIPYSELAPAA